MNEIVIFLPMRKGSERVKNKNTRDFANIKGGLTFIKISQLLKVKCANKIIISTNDDKVKKIAHSFNDNKIIIDERPENLSKSNTSTDDLIKYCGTIIDDCTLLWTHVTSPFVTEYLYDNMINAYYKNKNAYDSLMSVTKIQKFIWDGNKPLNYNKSQEKWPRTQTLKPIYEINSGAFIANSSVIKKQNDRIGKRPFYYILTEKEAFDIDWPIDFDFAECLFEKLGANHIS